MSYVGEVLQFCHDLHNLHDSLAFWVRQQSRNVHSFEAFEQRPRIKKSQAQNCDMCSELKRKCKSNCRFKVCEPAIAHIIYIN